MLGKISKVAAGATIGLVAMAPMAWAGGTGYDDPSDVKGEHTGDHDGDHGDKEKNKHHFSGTVCSFNGGDAEAASLINGDALLANVAAQIPVGGNNIGNLANCSDFLNNNLNGNLSNNSIAVLPGGIPAP